MAAGIGVGAFMNFETASDSTIIIGEVYIPNNQNSSSFITLNQEYQHLQNNLSEFWSQRGILRK